MQGQNTLELLTETLHLIFHAEHVYPAGSGAEKHKWVVANVRRYLEMPRSPALFELARVSEILETIGQLISIIVKLFNLLGVFGRSPADNSV